MAGKALVIVLAVQSPLAPTRIIGRGAASAANSTLSVPSLKPGGVLADATALERVGDHDHRRGDLDSRVERRQQEGLRSSSRFARAADPRGIDVRQRGEPVQCADAVPGLERGQAVAPSPQTIVQESMRERLAVVVAHHVVHEDHRAQLRPADAPLLDLGIDADRLPSGRAGRAGPGTLPTRLWPVEVAAEREARAASRARPSRWCSRHGRACRRPAGSAASSAASARARARRASARRTWAARSRQACAEAGG